MTGNKYFKKIVSTNGSITVFLALIMLPLVMFETTIMDLCALTASKQLTNCAGKLVANALLSDYDRQLHQEFGLMAFNKNGENLTKIAENIFDSNLKTEVGYGGLDVHLGKNSFDDSNWSYERVQGDKESRLKSVTISPVESTSLANKDVFKGQICDAMRYNYRATEAIKADDIDVFKYYQDSIGAIDAKVRFDNTLYEIQDSFDGFFIDVETHRNLDISDYYEFWLTSEEYFENIYKFEEEYCQNRNEWKTALVQPNIKDSLRTSLQKYYDEECNLIDFDRIRTMEKDISDIESGNYERFLGDEEWQLINDYISEWKEYYEEEADNNSDEESDSEEDGSDDDIEDDSDEDSDEDSEDDLDEDSEDDSEDDSDDDSDDEDDENDEEDYDIDVNAIGQLVALDSYCRKSDYYEYLKSIFYSGDDCLDLENWECDNMYYDLYGNQGASNGLILGEGSKTFKNIDSQELDYSDGMCSTYSSMPYWTELQMSQLVQTAEIYNNKLIVDCKNSINLEQSNLLISEYATEFFLSFRRYDAYNLTGRFKAYNSSERTPRCAIEYLIFGNEDALLNCEISRDVIFFTQYAGKLMEEYSDETALKKIRTQATAYKGDKLIGKYLRENVLILKTMSQEAKNDLEKIYDSKAVRICGDKGEFTFDYMQFMKLLTLMKVVENEDIILARIKYIIETDMTAVKGSTFSFDKAYTAVRIDASISVKGVFRKNDDYGYKSFASY